MPGLPEQLCPGVQVPQKPLPSQTWFDPHGVPAWRLPAPSAQVAAPLAQETVTSLHGDGLPAHALPPAQATQAPDPLQTMLLPQIVPGALLASSTQVCTPVAHEVMPLMHMAWGFVAQGCPDAQRPHCH